MIEFILIELSDGGADHETMTEDEVLKYLHSGSKRWSTWREAYQLFDRTTWAPGMWMGYPNGWIFCVDIAGLVES